MATDGTSFLPRILSVFYAIFHDNKGTSVVYQVPEGLIATPPSSANVGASSTSPPAARAISPPNGQAAETVSRGSSDSRHSQLAQSRETLSSYLRSSSAHSFLFKFEDISRYVIPPPPLCGRLVTCATRRHRIIGFPVELFSERYERNYFRYNVCFVFERTADLSCYEPIVRKIGRVLRACEEESSFLSRPETSYTIHAILEQLYEDLNSYSETSIPIDKFNSIELKIFPFYPNPPPVYDWAVPVALIDLKKRIGDNWDLTMSRVCSFIDGTNHVARIASLADCDLDLTRKAISHLLYYQVIMMIDIFQFSNMYTMCRSIEYLAKESHVQEECGPYVTNADREILQWSDLLHLYSRLKPGVTVLDWMTAYETHLHGIDPRRFTSFGVIKGFLRRVHRWPVLTSEGGRDADRGDAEKEVVRRPASTSPSIGRKRGKSLNIMTSGASVAAGSTTADALSPAYADRRTSPTTSRRMSEAEKYLEQFRRDISVDGGPSRAPGAAQYSQGAEDAGSRITVSPRASRVLRSHASQGAGVMHERDRDSELQRRHSLAPTSPMPSGTTAVASSSFGGLFPSATASMTGPTSDLGDAANSVMPGFIRPRLSRSPSSQSQSASQAQPPFAGSNTVAASASFGLPPINVPTGLRALLDGTRHADELGVLFDAGWPLLEKYLVALGGGRGGGDFGRVVIIYR